VKSVRIAHCIFRLSNFFTPWSSAVRKREDDRHHNGKSQEKKDKSGGRPTHFLAVIRPKVSWVTPHPSHVAESAPQGKGQIVPGPSSSPNFRGSRTFPQAIYALCLAARFSATVKGGVTPRTFWRMSPQKSGSPPTDLVFFFLWLFHL